MSIKNFYTANSVEPGDIFVVVIKAMVQYNGTYRLYRCPTNDISEPQGDRLYSSTLYTPAGILKDSEPISSEQIIAEGIFPILQIANGPDPS